MGNLWDLVQSYLDRQTFRVSERQLASKLGYASSSTFDNWREPKSLPAAQALARFAVLSEMPYQRVLDAALSDVGYLPQPAVTDEPLTRGRLNRDGKSIDDIQAARHRREAAAAARDTGRPSRGQRDRDSLDQAGAPPADDPDDMEPR